jgi:site-specific recombinase XerD
MLNKSHARQVPSDRQRAGVLAPYEDALEAWLLEQGYAKNTIRGIFLGIRAFSRWLHQRRSTVRNISNSLADDFVQQARCSESWRKTLRSSTGLIIAFLRARNVIAAAPQPAPRPRIVLEFGEWLESHRGVRPRTAETYTSIVVEFVAALSGDIKTITAHRVRQFVIRRAGPHGPDQAASIVTSTRAFIRFLAATGRCDPALIAAVPSIAGWRERDVPRHLAPAEVERVIASCDRDEAIGLRDRAVLLLLSRLGLRAGDVSSLSLDAFDWTEAQLRVAGKGRREEWLPLSQEVGDAVLAYIDKARPRVQSRTIFFTTRAPITPVTRWVVSQIVGRAIRQAGVTSPSHGAHVLRHSAAVRMLRAGSSLGEIGALLRHASIETTFHYAKVDGDLLIPLATPWPEPRALPVVDTRSISIPWLGVA